jgi:hypothetical protein
MKNIHILPTNKPSRLYEFGGQFILTHELTDAFRNYNIYITSDEEIKEGDWYFDGADLVHKKTKYNDSLVDGNKQAKKIILTTDKSLNGVQSIDNEFLEWFVKNPSCEGVDQRLVWDEEKLTSLYRIIIPQEKTKQETLEEAAKNWITKNSGIKSLLTPEFVRESFKEGAKWQQTNSDKKYTEEDLMSAFNAGINNDYGNGPSFDKWLNSLNKQD